MIDLSKWIKIDKTATLPVYLQISEGIITLIQQGILPAGVRIQTTRDLSKCLYLHRKTVAAAYDELLAQGWLRSKPRKGIFVSSVLPILQPVKLNALPVSTCQYPRSTHFTIEHTLIDSLKRKPAATHYRHIFNDGFPDVRLMPFEAFLREYHSLGKRKLSRKYLAYSAKEGSMRLREALGNNLRQTRGLPVTAENILVTKGAQMAIYMAASLLIKPGDCVIVGEPNYFLVNLMLKRLGAELCSVAVDDDGIDVDQIAAVCETKKIRMIYVIPHHHHPTTVTLSAERRRKLLDLAVQHQFAIIEDDYDFDIHYEGKPVLPIASIDHTGSIIYIGTLTKTLAPSIRIGFMVAPENFIQLAAQQRFMIDLQGDTLLEESIAELYNNGTIDRHMKKSRRVYKERRDITCELLQQKLGEHVSFKIPEGGMSIWTKFNGIDVCKVSQAAARNGLLICDGKKHNTESKNFNAICLGFASLNPDELREAIEILRRSFGQCK